MAARLKRRSSMGVRAFGAAATPNQSLLMGDETEGPEVIEAADEEEERRARRGIQKRQSFGHVRTETESGAAGTPGGAATGVSGYSAAQLADHYTNCMKLSAENKINIKNAFQLKLIDTMAEMLKKKKSEMDNFQAASCALDASTKIYAYRVDSVHNETLKLASGVGSSKGTEKGDAGGEGDLGDPPDGDVDDPAGKKKKKRKRASTVEKNMNNINCAKFELEFDIDPLFKKVSAQFDSGSGGGQFLVTLRMRDDGCELLLDSNAFLEGVAAEEAHSKDILDLATGDGLLTTIDEESLICPTFSKFSFRDWTLEQEELENSFSSQEKAAVSGQSAVALVLHNDEHAFDAEAAVDLEDGDDDLFGGVGMTDDVVEDDDNIEETAKNKPRVAMALLEGRALWDHLSLVPNEYSYFDTGRLGAWAGPKHWKFGLGSRGSTATTISQQDKRKKKQQVKERLDFEELDEKNNCRLDVVQKAMTLPKKAIMLQNRTMENWNEEKNMLPEDMHYSGRDFVKLEGMTRSNVAPRKSAELVDDSVEDYDFDNANDTENFCPDIAPGDANSYPVDEGNTGEFTNVFCQSTDTDPQGGCTLDNGDGDAMGLVAAPNRVEKIQIGYAKLAKKVDMRKLKAVEWSILQNSTVLHEADKENSKDDTNCTPRTTLGEGGATTFSEMYAALKRPNQLPTKMVDSLSVPLAFVALLHLCNEQTLELHNSSGNLTDLVIRKG